MIFTLKEIREGKYAKDNRAFEESKRSNEYLFYNFNDEYLHEILRDEKFLINKNFVYLKIIKCSIKDLNGKILKYNVRKNYYYLDVFSTYDINYEKYYHLNTVDILSDDFEFEILEKEKIKLLNSLLLRKEGAINVT